MAMNPKQIAKSKKHLMRHFRTQHEQFLDDRKSARRTDFMRASHKAFLRRKASLLQHPEAQK